MGLHHFGVALFEYNVKQEGVFKGTILSSGEKKEYTTEYQISVEGRKFICYIKNKSKKKVTSLEIGNIIEFNGKYNKPDSERNEGGFNYNLYLKSKKTYRSFQVTLLEKTERFSIIGLKHQLVRNAQPHWKEI